MDFQSMGYKSQLSSSKPVEGRVVDTEWVSKSNFNPDYSWMKKEDKDKKDIEEYEKIRGDYTNSSQ